MIGRSTKLQCNWDAWRLIDDGELALEMPAGNCCDMGGAIEVATAIMPAVYKIKTFSGDVPDMEYRYIHPKWEAFDMRPNTEAELSR